MDWSPFSVCGDDAHAPRPRGINTADGLGDRLRTAAFAERQARDAFLWAAEHYADAPVSLRAAWRTMAAEEGKHMGWLLARMAELKIEPAGRPVSDRLWKSLTACRDHAEFARYMARAEERGKAAEESFQRALAARDPVTARIFASIAAEEEGHIAVQRRAAEGVL